jgi:hypothetical protein
MPLLRSTDLLRKNDMLASNLLFATLLILLGEHLYVWIVPGTGFYSEALPVAAPWWRKLALLTWSFLLRAGLYYGVRRGLLLVKLLVAVGFLAWLYKGTDWQNGQVAGVSFTHVTGLALLALLRNLLTLAALVLMFRKPQVAPSSTSYV